MRNTRYFKQELNRRERAKAAQRENEREYAFNEREKERDSEREKEREREQPAINVENAASCLLSSLHIMQLLH